MTARFAVLVLCVAGCQPAHELEWRYRFESAALEDRAAHVFASIAEGTCADGAEPLYLEEFPAGGSATAAPPKLDPGSYALRIRARDHACRWYAEGCNDVTMPADGQELVVLSRISELAACDETSCDDAHAGAVFCNGFEADDFGDWDESSGGDGTVQQTTDVVYRGASSLHVHAEPFESAFVRENALGDPDADDWYVRAYVRITDGPRLQGIDLLHLQERDPRYAFANFSIGANQPQMYTDVPDPAVVLFEDEEDDFPRGRWVCVEAHVHVDPTDGLIEYWLDEEHRYSLSGITTEPGSPYDTLFAGIVHLSDEETDPVDVYLDELVVSHDVIGCD